MVKKNLLFPGSWSSMPPASSASFSSEHPGFSLLTAPRFLFHEIHCDGSSLNDPQVATFGVAMFNSHGLVWFRAS
ncbi:unnamed protein product [Linum trigynum]|uniref:Uncharacterized protein n=1 Tax=Linum trigynum TaxID=586398 RepID=A0AAV2G5U4_9ROSI